MSPWHDARSVDAFAQRNAWCLAMVFARFVCLVDKQALVPPTISLGLVLDSLG